MNSLLLENNFKCFSNKYGIVLVDNKEIVNKYTKLYKFPYKDKNIHSNRSKMEGLSNSNKLIHHHNNEFNSSSNLYPAFYSSKTYQSYHNENSKNELCEKYINNKTNKFESSLAVANLTGEDFFIFIKTITF